MAAHNELGKEGEDMAAAWLARNGFTILHRNWVLHQHEIDIIAQKGKFLHFIEVKTRKTNGPARPETAVNRRKFKTIQWAANAYLQQNPGYPWIRYDILAITIKMWGETEYFFIEDVFL
ncbi:MAG: YraN family protein [Chitinophagaceae bacterium]|nr:YraN family protein [Chitinophagaceae bacterium]